MAESMQPGEPMEPTAAESLHTVGYRRGPTWREWAISLIAAILLSVAATLLLGGVSAFRPDRPTNAGAGASGSACCPPTIVGK